MKYQNTQSFTKNGKKKEDEVKSRVFALEAELRKTSETRDAKARSLQESQRALAALVAKLGRSSNNFSHGL